jgi:hypothetical protein
MQDTFKNANDAISHQIRPLCIGLLEPISNSLEEHRDAGELHEAKEVFGVVLPTHQYSAFPLQPCEIALHQPASLIAS